MDNSARADPSHRVRESTMTLINSSSGEGGRKDIVDSGLVSPTVLFGYRCFAAAYMLTFFIWRISTIDSRIYFRYMTTLSWVGMGLYFSFAAIISYLYLFKGKTIRSKSLVSYLYDYFHACSHYFGWLVPITFWAMLYSWALSSQGRELFVHINHHVIDLVFIFTELVLSRVPFPLWHCVYAMPTLACYCWFTWVLYYGGAFNDWPYPFMEKLFDVRRTPGPTIAYFIGTIVLSFLVYLIPYGIHRARDALLKGRSMLERDEQEKNHGYSKPTMVQVSA